MSQPTGMRDADILIEPIVKEVKVGGVTYRCQVFADICILRIESIDAEDRVTEFNPAHFPEGFFEEHLGLDA
jgi:hypothetical protein